MSRSRFSPLLTHRPQLLRLLLALVAAIIIVASFSYATSGERAARPTTEPFLGDMRQPVETSAGQPRDGRDPAVQRQNSLASAASQPNGAGARADKPAAAVVGDTSHRVDPSSVLPDVKKTGIMSNGCLADYGDPGAQCVPAYGSDGKPITCDGIRKLFPGGVKVSGIDRFGFDGDRDKLACGPND